MNIRNFEPGDEIAQAQIYNTAAANLPHFKAASVTDVQRRVRAPDFDAGQRLYAVVDGRVVGYGLVNNNGRVSYPWCLPGFESAAPLLFTQMLETARRRAMTRIFAAYRADWPVVHDFFLNRGFVTVRSAINFLVDFVDLPTQVGRAARSITPLQPEDLPALGELYRSALNRECPREMRQHLFHNAYFTAEALYALRGRQGELLGVGILIYDPCYADPSAVDPAMPCFRLGAFGTEGMQTKRLNGLFSFLAKPDSNLPPLALDLMAHACYLLQDAPDATALAAQSFTDAPALLGFYDRYFRRQGAFPVFELAI